VFKRKPRITDAIYGKLMTSFGRVVDLDPLVAGPADALAQRVIGESAALATEVDRSLYKGAVIYHLRLLAGAWIMARDGNVPKDTAEVFEEAVAWKFEPAARSGQALAHRVSILAKGEGERDTRLGKEFH
jgi:hypothetical protein